MTWTSHASEIFSKLNKLGDVELTQIQYMLSLTHCLTIGSIFFNTDLSDLRIVGTCDILVY